MTRVNGPFFQQFTVQIIEVIDGLIPVCHLHTVMWQLLANTDFIYGGGSSFATKQGSGQESLPSPEYFYTKL